MKYTEVVKAIVEHVGGKDNISVATHCMTRLRLNLKDSSKVEEDALKKLDGVMGVVNKGQQTQIIIGASVNEVYTEFIEYTGMKEEAPVEENLDELKQDLKNRKGNLLTVFFETVAGIFNPIVPALAGAGLVRAILTIAVVCGLDNTGNTYMVINTIANGIFTFLPFLLAASAAKQFKMDTFVAMTICAGMMSSTWATLIGEGVSAFSFLKIPFTLVNYSSSVLPIVFAVWFASWVEKGLRKIIPGALKIIVVPCLTILVATPISLMTIGPLATWVGNLLANGVTVLFEKGGLFAGHNSLKYSPCGNFCFSKSYICSYKPIHWLCIFHIIFCINNSLHLIWGFGVFKGIFHFILPCCIRFKCNTLAHFAFSIKFQ